MPRRVHDEHGEFSKYSAIYLLGKLLGVFGILLGLGNQLGGNTLGVLLGTLLDLEGIVLLLFHLLGLLVLAGQSLHPLTWNTRVLLIDFRLILIYVPLSKSTGLSSTWFLLLRLRSFFLFLISSANLTGAAGLFLLSLLEFIIQNQLSCWRRVKNTHVALLFWDFCSFFSTFSCLAGDSAVGCFLADFSFLGSGDFSFTSSLSLDSLGAFWNHRTLSD